MTEDSIRAVLLELCSNPRSSLEEVCAALGMKSVKGEISELRKRQHVSGTRDYNIDRLRYSITREGRLYLYPPPGGEYAVPAPRRPFAGRLTSADLGPAPTRRGSDDHIKHKSTTK